MNSPIPRYPATRVTSPGVAAAAFAATNSADPGKERASALSFVDSVSEVIMTIEQEYRELLRTKLNTLADDARRAVTLDSSLRKLLEHEAKGTFPPFIEGTKEPKLQASKEFLAAQGEQLAAIKTGLKDFKRGALTTAITLKRNEVQSVRSRLAPEVFVPPLMEIVKARYAQVKDHVREPVWAEAGEGENPVDGDVDMDTEPGQLKIVDWRESPRTREVSRRLILDLPAIGMRIIMIAQAAEDRTAATHAAKKVLKAKADVEMGDATPVAGPSSNKSMKTLIDKAVASALKNASGPSSKGPVKKVRSGFVRSPSKLTQLHLERRQVQGRQRQGEEGQTQGRSRCPERRQEEDQGEAVRKGKEAWQQEVETWLLTQPIRYDHPSSWPDLILELNPDSAVRILHTFVPLNVLEASRYRSYVHVGPGVQIDEISSSILRELSLSYKYMFPMQQNVKLMLDAYNDFADRLRWKLRFIYKAFQGNFEERPFDPDYRIIKDRVPCDPIPYQGIEAAISAGRDYVRNCTLSAIPPKINELETTVPRGRIYRWLTENNCLVLPTDKNLGACIVTVNWYKDQCMQLLSNRLDYEIIDDATRLAILSRQRISILALSDLAANALGHQQLSAFLQQFIVGVEEGETEDDAHMRVKLPKFYGIPKIHKVPTKFRPIVPCHSAMQNPAAKFVSKYLKPLIEASPYVLGGSKQLAVLLNQFNEVSGKHKFYIVTGDVVAFYPNVPVDKGIEVVLDIWDEHYALDPEPIPRHMLELALEVALNNLIVQFGEQTYKQTRGLAMGVACSPDVANLFGHFHEALIVPNLNKLLFYKRYIDDVFALVEANSEIEAYNYMRDNLILEGCQIGWEVSQHHAVFLDMFVFRDPFTNNVEHMPYRKRLNHFERIPWDSAHPYDVKKGTFIGELSRLATLSSKIEYYRTAISDLCCVYISRGYPSSVINNWFRQYATKKWEARLLTRAVSEDPILVVKTEFNTAWDWFSIKSLEDTIMHKLNRYRNDFVSGVYGTQNTPVYQDRLTEWLVPAHAPAEDVLEHLGLPREALLVRDVDVVGGVKAESAGILDLGNYVMGNARWLVSRKRTQNFADLASLWRSSLLNIALEQDDFVPPVEL